MAVDKRYFLRRQLLTAAAVALPLLLLVGTLLTAQRRRDDAAASAEVQARADRAAREADAALHRADRVLRFLASRPELQTPDPVACAALLKGLTSVDPLLANVGAVDLQGNPLCRAVTGAGAFPNYAHVAWFKGAVAAAALDLDSMATQLLSTEGLPTDSVIALVAPDTTIIASSRSRAQWVGVQASPTVAQHLFGPDTAPFVTVGLDGTERLIASAALQHFGLRAGAGVPTEAVAADSRRRFQQSLIAMLVIGLAAFGLAWVGARKLTRPLDQLARCARQFGAGDMNARVEENMPGEFRPVAMEFNKAIAAYRDAAEAHRAQAAAEAASHAKSQFLAHMSHEVRTPMNAVLGMTDLALRSELPPRAREHLTHAQRAARTLLGVINDILDFSKIEAGKLTLEATPFRLQEVLDRVVAVVGVKAREKGLTLRVNLAGEVPAQVAGDPLRLEQVLVNLCSNAAKFTEQGGIEVSIAPGPAAAADRVALRFTVADTGPGMSKDQVASLFKPFAQLDASTTRRHGGTGLGLAISRQLVELMGGSILVRSAPGQGSEFSFSAVFGRVDRAQPAPAPAVEVPPAGQVPLALRGRRVLLVDDNEFNQIVAAELLSSEAGMQVTVADSGPQALALLAEKSFDAVLMDIQMPGMDGYQATALIRALPQHARLPLIAMTAHALVGDREKCLAAGLDDYITKPFQPAELFRVLAQRLLPGEAAPAAALAPGAAPAGVSLALGLQRCMGRQDLHQRVVSRFVETRADDGVAMVDAVATADTEQVMRIAHAMSSNAGTVGAARLSELARQIQACLLQGSGPADCRELVSAFAEEHARVMTELRAHLDSAAAAP